MLRALLLLSLAWNAIVPPARVCRTQPGEPPPICVPPSADPCCDPSPNCCAATSCAPPQATPPQSRTCSELICLLCPCRVPSTPQEPAPPGAKTVITRIDAALAAPFAFPSAPLRSVALESIEPVARHADWPHNARRSLLSVWLK